MLLNLSLDMKRRGSSCSRHFDMLGLLIQDAKGWSLVRPFLLCQRYYLENIRMPNSDIDCMRQSHRRSLVLRHKGNDLDDILVKHQCYEITSLSEENWIWRVSALVHLLCNLPSRDYINAISGCVVAN